MNMAPIMNALRMVEPYKTGSEKEIGIFDLSF
jgi:hypothetical protein